LLPKFTAIFHPEFLRKPIPGQPLPGGVVVMVGIFRLLATIESTSIEKLSYTVCSHVFIAQVKLNRNKAIFHFGFCIHKPVHLGNALTIIHR